MWRLRNAARPEDTSYGFDFATTTESVTVFTQGFGVERKLVRFDRTEKGISVSDGSKRLFEATLTLDDTGECRLKVNGQEREFWQFRKMALEALFFDA